MTFGGERDKRSGARDFEKEVGKAIECVKELMSPELFYENEEKKKERKSPKIKKRRLRSP